MSIFSKIQLPKVGSSSFNLSHDVKLSANMGDLIPILCTEVLPGDNFHMSSAQIARMMPMVAPVMHEVSITTHYFYVPNRILWDDWSKFITGGKSGLEAPLMPTVSTLNSWEKTGSDGFNFRLADYLGLPLNPKVKTLEAVPDRLVSAFPFLAYQKIYNEYYRDQNLQEDLDENLFEKIVNGVNNPTTMGITDAQYRQLFTLRKRSWQHDYFTSCLPFAQKGMPVQIPIVGEEVQIQYRKSNTSDQSKTLLRGSGNGKVPQNSDNLSHDKGRLVDSQNIYDLDNSQNLYADLDNATSATINDLRASIKLQEWLEKNARGGSRLPEFILSHFGVKSSDARLQRPEYIGGSTSPFMFSEVLQTSETKDSPQGNMAGHGLNLGKTGGINKFCEEHGYIIAIMSIMPKTSYQQGLHKQWTRNDKLDFAWPSFQHLGEQAVKNEELLLTDNGAYNDATFGYLPRYAEYKYLPSRVSGYMKTNLDFWHLGRKFDRNNPPHLNESFIQCNPSRRIFAVEDPEEDTIIIHVSHNINARRKLAYFSNPSFR